MNSNSARKGFKYKHNMCLLLVLVLTILMVHVHVANAATGYVPSTFQEEKGDIPNIPRNGPFQRSGILINVNIIVVLHLKRQ